MNALDIIKYSFSAINEKRLRSSLTILMVAIGIALITSLNGLSGGFNGFLSSQFNTLAPNVLTVTPVNPLQGFGPPDGGGGGGGFGADEPPKITLTRFVVDSIRPIEGVQDVIPSFRGGVQIISRGKVQPTQMLGMDTTKLPLIIPTLELEAGELISPNDPTGVGLGFNIAHPPGEDAPFARVGDLIRAEYQRFDDLKQEFVTDRKSFIVRGILAETGNPQYDNAIVVSLSISDSFLKKSSKFDSILVITTDADFNESVEEQIRSIYGEDIGVVSPALLLETINTVLSGFNAFFSAIGGVSILVGGVGIVTTLYTAVMERTREIGTLKAIGAKNRTVLFMFLTESFIIGVIGSATGLIGGGVLASFLLPIIGGLGGGGRNVPQITPIFIPETIATVFLVGVLVSTIAGLYPAWRAARLLPIVALRKE